MEIRLGFLDAFAEGFVVSGALDGALDLVGRVSHIAQDAPKILLAVRNALPAMPTADGLNSDMKPLPHRSQKNSNWYPRSVEWSVWLRVN
jgi:hypothetical protein